ncbi:helix-turn-helix domain-containing protein [Catenuloplanes indicus]|uniref:Excisionase family DNA binding protein n=1 Tax=Catenuloplanes indicus TaxID=137267 RepID=A0AAE3VT26_9ACTN|nr:helix-turn-helix domain-containing protein [Catenuloplanes indicus]MDQ0363383.1 excisionase family DNA binding protein [Catenuloplanes indicus]
MNEYLTPAEARTRIKVSKTFMSDLLTSGRLRSSKVGRLRRIAATDLEEYMKARIDRAA